MQFWSIPHHWQCTGIFLLLSACYGSCVDFTADNATLFTLHTTRVTWPEARDICASTGEVLLDMSDSYKRTILQDLFTTASWITALSSQSFKVWIGLYDIDPPNQMFVWTDSCVIQTETVSWFTETNTNATDRCVLSRTDMVMWQAANCGEKHMFVCEFRTDQRCPYHSELGVLNIMKSENKANSDPEGGTTVQYCRDACETNPSCWATYFNPVGVPFCVEHIASNPEALSYVKIGSFSTNVKDCVLDLIHYGNVTGSQDFPSECLSSTTGGTTGTTTLEMTSSPWTLSETENISETTTQTATTTTRTPEMTLSSSTPETETISASTEQSTTKESEMTSAFSTVSEKESISPTTEPTTDTTLISKESKLTSSRTFPDLTTAWPITEADKTSTTLDKAVSSSTVTSETSKPKSSGVSTENACVGTSPDPRCVLSTETTTPGVAQVVTPDTYCLCPCYAHFPNLTEAQKVAYFEEILENLTINKSSLSSTRRRYISVPDKRPSAQYVGASGLAIISAAILLIVVLDIQRLISYMKNMHRELFLNPQE